MPLRHSQHGDREYVPRQVRVPAGKSGASGSEQTSSFKSVDAHTLRHTCITALAEQRLSASVISAVVGISVQSLRTRYNHPDSTALQPLAHACMFAVLTRH
jgi:integrase